LVGAFLHHEGVICMGVESPRVERDKAKWGYGVRGKFADAPLPVW